MQVEIDEDGIRVVDDMGELMRVTEYRYVRSTEVRKICITVLSKDHSKHRYPYRETSGVEEEYNMVCINRAWRFEALKLRSCSWKDKEIYWCDDLLFHPDCIAFVYSEDAWKLLHNVMAVNAPSI